MLVQSNLRPSGARSILWNLGDNTWAYVGGSSANVMPIALTNEGVVLGWALDAFVAVICKPNGAWEYLGTNSRWSPVDINDAGDVVGSVRQEGLDRPWLRDAAGAVFLLPYVIGHHTGPKAINNSGDVVGTAQADHGGHAVIWHCD